MLRSRTWSVGIQALATAGCLSVPPAESETSEGSTSEASGPETDAGSGPSSATTGGGLACDPGFADCDGRPENGCEASTIDDPDNCGTCGERCLDIVNGVSACMDSQCTVACDDGWGDCDGMADSGCEQPLDTTTHCGACDRDCGGSACDEGMCAPQAIVTGLGCPQGLAVVGEDLYICDFCNNQIVRAPKNGGPTMPVADVFGCAGLATDGTDLYAGEYNQSNLVRVSLDSGVKTTLYSGGGVHGVWVTGSDIYWSEHNAQQIRIARDGDVSQPETIASGFLDRPTSVAAIDGVVLFTDYGTGAVYMQGEGMEETLSTGNDSPFYITADDLYFYWTNGGNNDAAARQVMRMPRDSSEPPIAIANEPGRPSGIILDGDFVYFAATDTGTVSRINR